MGERLTQTGLEGVIAGTPHVRLSQAGIEGVIGASPNARVTSVGLEVLIANTPVPQPPTQPLNRFYPQFVRGLTFPSMKTAVFDTTFQEAPNKYAVPIANTFNPIWHWTLTYNYLKNNPSDVVPIYSPWTDYEIMQGFFLQNTGKDSVFLLTDPGITLGQPDNYVGPALQNQSWQANRLYLPLAIVIGRGHVQQATTVTGLTGWTIPTFSITGGTVSDGGVTWQDQGAISGGTTYPNPNAQLQLVTDGQYWYSPLQRNFGGQFLEDITDLNTIPTLGGSALSVYLNGLPVQVMPAAYQIGGPFLSLSGITYYGSYLRWFPWRAFQAYLTNGLLIDLNGHLQQATADGVTGTLQPSWNDSGGVTLDGSVLWQDLGLAGPVTAQFNFFFRARFEMDEFDFEQYLSTVWTVGGPEAKNGAGYIKLQSVRPGLPPLPTCEVYPWNL